MEGAAEGGEELVLQRVVMHEKLGVQKGKRAYLATWEESGQCERMVWIQLLSPC